MKHYFYLIMFYINAKLDILFCFIYIFESNSYLSNSCSVVTDGQTDGRRNKALLIIYNIAPSVKRWGLDLLLIIVLINYIYFKRIFNHDSCFWSRIQFGVPERVFFSWHFISVIKDELSIDRQLAAVA